ncbi:hypothetical protein SFC07_10150 [Corynebacterium callunae]|uniref:hypothetical protein n=1 Tax=Corynebacterium callunae TaxID=1721 RepID=UPI00398236F5
MVPTRSAFRRPCGSLSIVADHGDASTTIAKKLAMEIKMPGGNVNKIADLLILSGGEMEITLL